MNETFRCGDPGALVAYLYDECEPDERNTIGAHVATCAHCAAELASLGDTRRQLAAWSPPERTLGFRVGTDSAPMGRQEDAAGAGPAVVRAGPWWHQPLPAWAQMAAAGLIFAAGLWVGAAQERPAESFAAVTATPAAAVPAAAAVSPDDLVRIEEQLRAEIAAVRAESAAAAPVVSRSDDQEVLRRVRALIEESEARQQRQLALRTSEVALDLELQRMVDMAQIQRIVGEMQGATGAEVRQQREALNSLYNYVSVSQAR